MDRTRGNDAAGRQTERRACKQASGDQRNGGQNEAAGM